MLTMDETSYYKIYLQVTFGLAAQATRARTRRKYNRGSIVKKTCLPRIDRALFVFPLSSGRFNRRHAKLASQVSFRYELAALRANVRYFHRVISYVFLRNCDVTAAR